MRTPGQETPGQEPKNGFTLVELLVVIGIIAVLLAILLPVISRAREAANQIACAANLRTIGQAIFLYSADYNGTLPIGQVLKGQYINPGFFAYGGDSTDWTVLIVNEVYHDAGNSYIGQYLSPNFKATRAMFVCPTAPENRTADQGFTDYSCNPRIMPSLSLPDETADTFTYLRPYKLAHIKRSSEIAMIFDGSGYWGSGYFFGAYDVAEGMDNAGILSKTYMTDWYSMVWAQGSAENAGTPIDLTDGMGLAPFSPIYYNTDSDPNVMNIRFRHTGDTRANVLMVDGHVQSFSYNPRTHLTDMHEGNINVNK